MRKIALLATVTFAVGLPICIANAAVYGPRQQLPPTVVSDFLANTKSLAARFPDGGPGLISFVRDLAASNPATLQPLLDILKAADPKTQGALITGIASGLAQAARMATRTDQQYADDIARGAAGAGDAAFAAYKTASGDVGILSTGGGSGAAGGGTGGGGATGNSGSGGGSGGGGGGQQFGGLHYSTTGTSGLTSSSGGSVTTGQVQ